jgi:hypothetical protein
VDELFSKLKSTKIDHQTRAKIENPSAPTMALVSGGGSASNSSPAMFALSSLLSITEEQVESLGDEELALVASRLTRFHNNRMSQRHGGSKDGCYNCGDPNHFVASCPKKGKSESGPRDHHSGRRKDKYSSGKYKSKGGFNKEALKKKYLQKAKIKEHAFLASLSDLDHDSDDVISSSSDDETERWVEDKLNGLCFIAYTARGFCTMALGEDAVGTSNNKDIGDDTTSEVLPSADDLAAEIEELNSALLVRISCLGRLLVRGESLDPSMRARLGNLSLLELQLRCPTRLNVMSALYTCRRSPLCRPSTLPC